MAEEKAGIVKIVIMYRCRAGTENPPPKFLSIRINFNTLKMEIKSFSEALATIEQSTRRHNQGDSRTKYYKVVEFPNYRNYYQ
jgi:hypothetical protein